jgi:gliding motility-associated-like protein
MLDKTCPQTLLCVTTIRNGIIKSIILFFLFSFAINSVKAQSCNLGGGWNYSDPNSSCNTQTRNLGAGEYGRMFLQNGVTYEFRLRSSGAAYYTSGICIDGNSGGLVRTFRASRTGNHNIGTSRTFSFNYNSATLEYKAVVPSTPSGISGPTQVCSGATSVRYSISSASNANEYEWQFSGNGSSFTTITRNGGTSINVDWPNVVDIGEVRVRSINGPCISSWRFLPVNILAQPTAPSTAGKTPNVAEVCMSQPVGLSSNASGGIDQSCSIYYRYTTDGGNVWSMPSLSRPTGIKSRTPGLNSIQIQARRQNCSTTGCNTTSWNTVASWNVEVTAPVVVTKNIDVYLNLGGTFSLPSNAVDNGSTDNCGIASFSVVPNNFNCSNIGNNTVTLTVTDSAGNFSSRTANVNVIDTVAPTVLTQNIFIQLDSLGRDTITASMIDNGTNDACGVDTIYLDNYFFDCNNLGKNVVTLTAVDIHGNISSKTANVVVQDPIKPTLITQDTTLILDANGNAKLTPEMIDGGTFDNCSFTLFTIPSSFTCNDLGPNTVLVIASDAASNVVFSSAVVTISDTISPTITAPGPIQVFADTACGAIVNNLGTPVTADNCSVTSITNDAPAKFPLGTTTVTWTASDVSGNFKTATQLVEVIDNSAPTISAPTAITVAIGSNCTIDSAAVNFQVIADDNCTVTSLTNDGPSSYSLGNYFINWTAVDQSGNVKMLRQAISVVDSTAPVITLQPNVTVLADANCAATMVVLGQATATDNCNLVSLTNNAPLVYPIGETKVTWTAIDASGNVSKAIQLVNVTDQTAPQITCVSGSPFNKSTTPGVCGYLVQGNEFTPQGTDNCSPVTFSHNIPSSDSTTLTGVILPVGNNQIIWTARDAAGNSSTCTTQVVVVDSELPTISGCPVNQTLTTGQYSCGSTPNWTIPTATDNCGIASFTQTNGPSPTATLSVGSYLIEYMAIDVYGNSAVCSFTINVVGSSAPIITCPVPLTSISADSSSCYWTANFRVDPIQAVGSCPRVTWEIIDPNNVTSTGNGSASGQQFLIGTSTLIYTITDTNNVSATCTTTVNVVDDRAPIVVKPNDLILYSSNSCAISNPSLGSPTATDNCGIASTINNAPASFQLGKTTVVWEVEDNYGNKTFVNQIVTVIDSTAPSLVCSGSSYVRNATTNCEYVAIGNEFDAMATENCSLVSLTHDYSSATSDSTLSNAIFPKGTTSVVWTAVDKSGNTASCTIQVVVEDNEAPIFTSCPSDITIGTYSNCSNIDLWTTPVATDNCSAVSITQTSGPSPNASLTAGVYTVTYEAVDADMNVAVCSFDITVNNANNPVIACKDTIIQSPTLNNGCTWISTPGSVSTNIAAADCPRTLTWSIINPDSTVVNGVDDASGYEFQSGISTLIYTLSDSLNTSVSCQTTIIVTDVELPSIVAPNDTLLYANNSCEVNMPSLGTPFTSDNCFVFSVSNDAPSTFGLGSTIVHWTVQDGNGNTAIDSQLVMVVDTTSPVIQRPLTVTAGTDSLCFRTSVNLGSLISADNCAIDTVYNNAPAFYTLGTNTVLWTVIDESGNRSTINQTVIIEDTVLPTIIAPNDTTVTPNSGCFAVSVGLGTPLTNDNCGIASVSNNAPAIFLQGTTVVTWTITDNAGNSSTATQNVFVVDTLKPVLSVPSNLTVSANNGCDATGVQLGNATAIDNCAIASITNNGLSAYPKGVTNVTWTAIDVNGNITTAIQTVTVIDNTKPSMTAPANLTVAANTSCGATGVNLGVPASSDNCGAVTISNDAPITFPLGLTTVTWTGIDSVGNTVTGTQTVQVNDSTPPAITAPSAVTLYTNNGCFVMNPSLGTATTTDNCTVASITNDAPTSFTVGTTVVTWTVADAAGNTTSDTQTVLVLDTVKPTIIAPSNIALSVDSNCQVSGLALGRVITSDNCAIDTVINNAPVIFNVGQTVITWTVTDVNGNSATANQLVTISDITPPVITAPADISIATNVGCSANGVVLGSPIATDNCAVTSITNNAPATFPEGITTVVWTAVDANGNRATAQQVVNVIDSTAPVLTPPADLVYNTNNGCFAVNVPLGTPIATDNCFLAALSNNAPSSYPIGNTTITWTAIDVEGNVTTATQLVTIVDAQKPTLIVPSDIEVNSNLGCSATNIDLGTPVVTDNCGIRSISNNAPTVYPLGQTIVVWTVEDSSGNITSDNQFVLVKDTIIPDAKFNDITIQLSPDGSDYEITVADVDNGTSDNCGIQSIELSQYFFDCFDLGQNRVIATVIDNYGNEVDKSFIVTVTPSNEDADFDGIDDACDDNVNTTIVVVPNGFTPDGDNYNDLFVIPGLGQYTQVELEIFNQYGNRVYQSKNYQNDWDGTSSESGAPLNDDTYFYVLTLDGKTTKQGYVYINRIR